MLLKRTYPKLAAFLLALTLCGPAGAQRILFNSPSNVYEILGTPGNFTYKDLGHFCAGDTNDILSTAMHGDTLYMLSPTTALYQVILSTGSCQLLTKLLAAPNNLTSDDNGLLYYNNAGSLSRYDPHTNTIQDLGEVPVSPDGDMLFYNGMLLCSGNGTELWAIDPDNPSAAFELMSTGNYLFYGLVELPDNCKRNRLFGLDELNPANIVEIDPVSWTLGSVVGQTPNVAVYDAASTAEDGTVQGVFFDSLSLVSPCGNVTTGSIQAFASSSTDGATSYTLDGVTTNTTGLFPNVPAGTHTIQVASGAVGCSIDSTFVLEQGLSSLTYQVTPPEDCAHPTDGNIQVAAVSQALPILYTLNNIGPGPVFDQLDTGTYTLQVVDAGHCEKDTTITLGYQHVLPFPATLTITPALCAYANGDLTLSLNSGIDPGSFRTSFNFGPASSTLDFPGLKSGINNLLITYGAACRFDSVVTIPMQMDPEPAIQATVRNQVCFTDNGNLSLSVNGAAGPYLASLNGGAFSAGFDFAGLAPGRYAVQIQDGNGCLYDTSLSIEPYPRDAITIAIDTVNPICTTLNSGSLRVTIQGDQAPYWLAWSTSTYPGGSVIGGLNQGDFSLPVIDKDGCVVDTVHAHLDLDIEPECEQVYLPNAFTPNGNGINDLFRVLRSPYIRVTGFRVFNRYGGLVFTGNDQHPGWDGTFHGAPQPAGTYVWEVGYIDLMNMARTVHGIVMLIR